MDRKSFWGNDEDYGNPYQHRYDEPDSDRGASDEHHNEQENIWMNGKR